MAPARRPTRVRTVALGEGRAAGLSGGGVEPRAAFVHCNSRHGEGPAGKRLLRALHPAGGVAVSGLEMVQNRVGLYWSRDEVRAQGGGRVDASVR